jgi:hypothetical protein
MKPALLFILSLMCLSGFSQEFHDNLAIENYKKGRLIEVPYGESVYLKMDGDWYRGIFMGISSDKIILTSDTIVLSSVEGIAMGAPKVIEEGVLFTGIGGAATTVFAGLLLSSYYSGDPVVFTIATYGIAFAGTAVIYGVYRLVAGAFNRLAGKGPYFLKKRWTIGPSY